MITIENTSHSYGQGENSLKALESINLNIERGESVAFIGPSGCGKSTLLFLLAGLLTPTTGLIKVSGNKLAGQRHHTALILQDYGLFPWKTVWQNAALGLQVRGFPQEQQAKIVLPILEELGLAKFINQYPTQLSGGQRQRVAIARSLAIGPDLLLMDEPFSSLDALTRENLQDVMVRTQKEKEVTLVLVTHNIEEAVYLGSKIVVFTPRPGRIAGIIQNPLAGTEGHRLKSEFHAKCTEIRRLLEVGSYGLS